MEVLKIKLLYVLILSITFSLPAQELKLESVAMEMNPQTVLMQRKDLNGQVCALVKVIMPGEKVVFEGSLIGDCPYKTSEYWCYLSPGTKSLKIKYPNLRPLLIDFTEYFGAGVKDGRIYNIVVRVPQGGINNSAPIRTIQFNIHSSQTYTLLGGEIYEEIKGLKIVRRNSAGLEIDTFDKPDYTSVEASLSHLYKFNLGGVEGDVFEISAPGYKMEKFMFDGRNNNTTITLYPQVKSVTFIVIDSITRDPLIGASVYQNKKIVQPRYSNWDNWEKDFYQVKYDNGGATDLDGLTKVFNSVKTTDEIECSYVGYKTKKVKFFDIIQEQRDNDNLLKCIIELVPYGAEEDFDLSIRIGSMGINDKGSVQISNERSGEVFTMSQKTNENIHHIKVRFGDVLLFTRKGFRPVSVKFEYNIPERINIAPLKGKKSDVQYLKF